MIDVRDGIVSVHAKLWVPGNDLQPIPMELRDKWEGARQEMERYYKVANIGKNLNEKDMRRKLPPWP